MSRSRTTPGPGARAVAARAAAPAPAAGERGEATAKLIAVLESDAAAKEKMDACRELAVVGTAAAIPVLAGLLSDEKLSHMARYALEPMPDPAVDGVFREALGRVKGRQLAGVIASIGARRDAAAAGALGRLLESSEEHVARTAAWSLGRIGTREAARLLRARLASAPAPLRRALADGCLACAEKLLAGGDREPAAALYEAVGEADLPAYVRDAARRGRRLAR